LQRPLFRKDTFQKRIESALNTKDKTIVSIIQMTDWLKTKVYDAYINSFTTAKKKSLWEAIFFLVKNEYRIEESGKKVGNQLTLAGISDVTLSRRATIIYYHSFDCLKWRTKTLTV
jgi:hypothetical protein